MLRRWPESGQIVCSSPNKRKLCLWIRTRKLGPVFSSFISNENATNHWWHEWYALYHSAISADSRVINGIHLCHQNCNPWGRNFSQSVPRLTTPWSASESWQERYWTRDPWLQFWWQWHIWYFFYDSAVQLCDHCLPVPVFITTKRWMHSASWASVADAVIVCLTALKSADQPSRVIKHCVNKNDWWQHFSSEKNMAHFFFCIFDKSACWNTVVSQKLRGHTNAIITALHQASTHRQVWALAELEVLQNSASWMFMLRVKTLSVQNHPWWVSRKKT